jgi:predicted DsbA family dithiol-disulfide isomerase
MISPGKSQRSGHDKRSSPAELQVDVIADLICPWCYLGKRRLNDALSAVHGPSIVNWFPFQLNPTMPESGMPFDEYLTTKFGDPEKLQPAIEELTRLGRAEGITFRFDRLHTVPNSLNAHRLMKLAEIEGADNSKLAEHILSAFFEKGDDISNIDVLAGLGAMAGLEAAKVIAMLDDDKSRRVVLAQEAQVRQSGVTGVPDFLINKRLFVVGAQSTDGLVSVFDRAMFGEESDLLTSPTVH